MKNQDLQVLQELAKKYTNPGVFANHIHKNSSIYIEMLKKIYPYLFVEHLNERESISICVTYFWRNINEPIFCPICGKLKFIFKQKNVR